MFVAISFASEIAPAQDIQRSPPAIGNWVISETTSPVDYSPVVVVVARSREGEPGSEMQLSIDCRKGQTNLVVTGQTISGPGSDYAISYRINSDRPVQIGASATGLGAGAVLQVDVIRLLQSLPEEGDIAIRLAPRTGTAREGTFSLEGLKPARTKLAAACKWPQAVAKPRN
ncbi:hypothetical protein [Bradyrhizobium sp. LTSPM299]|uniref:hypothetical protein n=1 Tax=Bradyrhizobium sp. LTSPM299 TaxID=1619233 RepID=UPI0012E1CDAD|nr:hypothetical protein [Bradyrhizobium sp. LTSPM299]